MEAVVALLNLRDIPELDSATRVEIYEGEKKPFNVESDEKAVVILANGFINIEFETGEYEQLKDDDITLAGSTVICEDFSIKTLSKKSLVFVIKIKKHNTR